jgi:hypothetical protein
VLITLCGADIFLFLSGRNAKLRALSPYATRKHHTRESKAYYGRDWIFNPIGDNGGKAGYVQGV